MGKELIFEIGTEEIPSGYIPQSLSDLKDVASSIFVSSRIEFDGISTFATPRRLTIYIKELAERQKSSSKNVIGPSKVVAFDDKGKPTKAALGFAKAQGVSVEDLKIFQTEKGEYLCAFIEEKGDLTENILPVLLPKIISMLSFPKQMRWRDLNIRFVRPIRWLMVVYGGNAVSFEIEGIQSSNVTYGHRFLSPGAITISNFTDYENLLEKNYVIVNHEKRKALIREKVKKSAEDCGGVAIINEDLLNTVNFLVEYPVAINGNFPREFLKLPKELVLTPMQKQQKYFSVMDKQGDLMPVFILISNMLASDTSLIKSGNERVLVARLSDADFYFKEDQKIPLSAKIDDLKRVSFQEKLGTLYDKTHRIKALAGELCGFVDTSLRKKALRAAELCKADLITGVVKEFPELEGIMGREYLRLAGEDEEICIGIGEHYKPRFSGDDTPKTRIGAIISICDKLDSIVGCFGIGLMPTGSEDPYGLRRSALGIVTIILDNGFRVSLSSIVEKSVDLFKEKISKAKEILQREVVEFICARFISIMQEHGIKASIIDSVVNVEFDDIIKTEKKIKAITSMLNEPDFEPLIVTFKRAANILPSGFSGKPDTSLFERECEGILFKRVVEIKAHIEATEEKEDYISALREIARLRPYIDQFFNEVMVMVEDEKIKNNRLSLLYMVNELFSGIADLKKLTP